MLTRDSGEFLSQYLLSANCAFRIRIQAAFLATRLLFPLSGQVEPANQIENRCGNGYDD